MAERINAKVHVLKHKSEAVTSYYGGRKDPISGVWSGHMGIDLIGGVKDETIIAAECGTVTAIRNSYKGPTTDGSGGNYIRIRHSNDTYTLYKHLKQNSLKVKVGQHVVAGQALAVMGNTGHSTGTHLHFDVEVGGTRVDPLPYLLGEKPIAPTVHGQRGDKPELVWGNEKTTECKTIMLLLNALDKARILADGNPGSRTYKYAIKHTVKANVDGAVSRWVQQRLKTMGYYTGKVDGEPRSVTASAIKKMQTEYGLTVDGVVSGTDWYYLLEWEG